MDLSPLYRCSRALSLHHGRPPTPRELLLELGQWAPAELESDSYGTGTVIAGFERDLAVLLGKPEAAFFPSGIMAQQAALRIHADARSRTAIGLHPRSHLIADEENALVALSGLRPVVVGDRLRGLTLDDLRTVREPLAAFAFELPQRRIATLPGWDELQRQLEWVHEHGAAAHLDGARLWEITPHYRRTPSEIAAGFDSVYVSFYKGLGGLAGAALAGEPDVVDQARVWRRRMGGTLIHLFPYVCSARRALELRLDRMTRYRDRARELAAIVVSIPGLAVVPDPPLTNGFQVHVGRPVEAVERAALEVARVHDLRILGRVFATEDPGTAMFEITVGDAAFAVEADEVRRALRTFASALT